MKTRYVLAAIIVGGALIGATETPAAENSDFLRIIHAGMLDFTEMHCRDLYTQNQAGSDEIVSVYQEARNDSLTASAFETGQKNVDNMVRLYGVEATCDELVNTLFSQYFE